ncbi:hypothetical protein TRFO_31200 [Tritrichomonas foetus]|uniref:Right handed beta helix domain-containing protein n=1 Tax=Tritrichomonas foetus TaxID=1144522 RepID=A0A1J4JS00_9EUKA|nr:hypothetical protein TRFO_31200 [Tritrichomonas foetus]|eukprot:OHT01905.1 hypothetical protein TRFO_31200 [Tritrichomonas foetus]
MIINFQHSKSNMIFQLLFGYCIIIKSAAKSKQMMKSVKEGNKKRQIYFGNPIETRDEEVAPENFEVIKDDSKRIYRNENKNTYSVYINGCHFQNFDQNPQKSGGAIYLYRTGVRCVDSKFNNCLSKSSGGAVYVMVGNGNNNRSALVCEYIRCIFHDCKSEAGGGLFIWGNGRDVLPFVNDCIFYKNEGGLKKASEGDEGSVSSGGGGLLIQGHHSIVQNSKFYENKGIGCNILIYGDTGGSIDQIKPHQIINCTLTILTDEYTSSSLFYAGSKKSTLPLEIISCIFDGTITDTADLKKYQINTNKTASRIVKITFENTFICTGRDSAVEEGFDEKDIIESGLIFECPNSTDPTEPVQPSENPTEPIQPTEKPTENPPKPGDLTPLECGKAVRKEDGQSTYSFYIDDCEFSGFSSSGSSNGGAICLKNYGLRCLNSRFSSCESKEGKGGAIFHQIGAVSSQNTTEYVMEYYNCNFTSCTAVAGGGLYLYNTKSTNYIYVTKCTFNNNRATKTDSSGDDEANANVGGGGLHFQGFHATISNCIFSDNFGIGSNILISMNDKGQIQDTKLINCNLTLKGSNDAKSSLYYSAGKNADKGLFIKSCIFDGSVNEESYQINTNSEKDNNPMIRFEGTYICTGEYRVIEGGFTTNIPKDGLIFECSNSTDPTEKPTKPIDPSQTANPSNVPHELTCHDNERCDFGEGTVENTTKVIIEKSKFSKIHGDSDGGAVFISGYSFSCTKSKFEDCSSKNQGGAIYLKLGLRKYEKDLHAEIADSIFKDCKAKGGAGIFAHSTVAGRLIYINKCEFENNEAVNMSKSDDASILTSESSDINIGGGGIFFVTNGGFVENCVFKDNKGIGADMIIYVSNDIDSSLRQQTIIRKCNFYFEGDDESPSSIYLIRNTKNAINVTLQDCVFKGEISIKHGIVPHFIDADELKSRSGLLVLKDVYFCGFDEEQAFQGNVSNYINVSESSYFFDCTNLPNDKESETGLSKGGKVAIAIVIPLVVIAVIIVVVIFLVFKKKNTKMTQEEPTNELSETFQSSTDFYASQGSENNPIGFTSNMEEQDPFMREFEEASNVSPV